MAIRFSKAQEQERAKSLRLSNILETIATHSPEELKAIATKRAVKRGRGRPLSGKETVTLRLDAKIVAYYKTYGDDWRWAMEDALRKAAAGF